MMTANSRSHTCCFLGHRMICETEELKAQLLEIIEYLITEQKIDTFLFGSKSQFDRVCYGIVTKIKEKYRHIKRIYVRAEFPLIDDDYHEYLLERYEDTYYPESILGARKSVYIQRNFKMIENSRFCIFYYDRDYVPQGRKSGTKIALDYARKRSKEIYTFPNK